MTIASAPARRASIRKDSVLFAAVDAARAAAEEIAAKGDVGELVETVMEGERLATHYFECSADGYRGWRWAVTVARPPRGKVATVCEAELLPGPESLLAPLWVPWAERLQPEDVGRSDVLPFTEDDPRLEPGYTCTDDAEADAMAVFEFGLGRPRVLSPLGRAEAAERWYGGAHGPQARGAAESVAKCGTCGFLMLMAGSVRTLFGVCANEWSPDDGEVVSMDHGCGAHSETDVPERASEWPLHELAYDDARVDLVSHLAVPGEDEASPGDNAEATDKTANGAGSDAGGNGPADRTE